MKSGFSSGGMRKEQTKTWGKVAREDRARG